MLECPVLSADMEGFRPAEVVRGSPRLEGRPFRRPGLSAGVIFESESEVRVPALEQAVLVLSLSGHPVVESDLMGRPERRTFEAGRFGLLPAGRAASFVVREPSTFFHVHMGPDFLDGLVGEGAGARVPPRFADHDPVVERLGRALHRLSLVPDRDAAVIEPLFEALALTVFGPRVGEPTPSPLRRGGLAPWQVERCRQYLEAHLAETPSLDSLAQLVGLSRFHFARSFKESTGRTPLGYLRYLRVARAKALLVETTMPLEAVGAAVGYATPRAFTRMFHTEVGIPPSHYRRLERRRPTARRHGDGLLRPREALTPSTAAGSTS